MAKRNDNMNLFEEIKAREAELQKMKETAREDLEGQLESIINQFDEFELPLPEFLVRKVQAQIPAGFTKAPRPTDKGEKKERQPRSCSICRAAGLVEESKGHIAKTHGKFIEKHPELARHFKGSLTNGEGEPRLVAQ